MVAASTGYRLAQKVKMTGKKIARVISTKKLGKAQPDSDCQALATFDIVKHRDTQSQAVTQALTNFDIVEHIINAIDDILVSCSLNYNNGYYGAFRLKMLHPLLFVCRAWYPVILRKLYSSLSFEAMIAEDHYPRRQRNNHALYQTLLRNPSFCGFVKSLRLEDDYVRIEESNDQLPLPNPLRLCKNVQHLEIMIHGKIPADQLQLIDMLKEFDLIDFRLSLTSSYADRENNLFSAINVVPYIWHWQSLREVKLDMVFEAEDKAWSLPDPSSVKGRCPSLRKIDLTVLHSHRSKYSFSSCLLILSEVAPHVEDLSYWAYNSGFQTKKNTEFTDAIATCLEKWSSTLQRLKLRCYTLLTNLSPILLSLKCLRELDVDSEVVPPSDLFRLTDLEVLTYRMSKDHLREVVHHFTGEIALHKLKRLDFLVRSFIGPKRLPADVDLSPISTTCRARGIMHHVKPY